jgi:hypothetical protein
LDALTLIRLLVLVFVVFVVVVILGIASRPLSLPLPLPPCAALPSKGSSRVRRGSGTQGGGNFQNSRCRLKVRE